MKKIMFLMFTIPFMFWYLAVFSATEMTMAERFASLGFISIIHILVLVVSNFAYDDLVD